VNIQLCQNVKRWHGPNDNRGGATVSRVGDIVCERKFFGVQLLTTSEIRRRYINLYHSIFCVLCYFNARHFHSIKVAIALVMSLIFSVFYVHDILASRYVCSRM